MKKLTHARNGWLLAVFILVSGCGPKGPAMHPVTGKVTFNGQPVKEGTITFEDPTTGAAQQAVLAADGTYSLTLQEGSYQAFIEPLVVEKNSGSDSPPDYSYKKADDIPQKYHTATTSGLTHTVSSPSTFDVDMKR